VLQCVAVCCSVLQCVAVCCSVLQCVAVCCSVLHTVSRVAPAANGRIVCCSMLRCVAVCCSVLQCGAVLRSVVQCGAVCCSVLQFVAVCRSVSQCVAASWVTNHDSLKQLNTDGNCQESLAPNQISQHRHLPNRKNHSGCVWALETIGNTSVFWIFLFLGISKSPYLPIK